MPLAYASILILLAAINFNLEAFGDTSVFLQELVGGGAMRLQWSYVIGMFGYYLLLMPLALFLLNLLKPKSPNLVRLFTLFGIGYLLFGAMASAIMAIVLPAIVDAYSQATGDSLHILEVFYEAFRVAFTDGVWGVLNPSLAGVWWVGIGVFLQSERRLLGWVTILLGAFILLTGIGTVVRVEAGAIVAILYLSLAPVWVLWLGISLLTHALPQRA